MTWHRQAGPVNASEGNQGFPPKPRVLQTTPIPTFPLKAPSGPLGREQQGEKPSFLSLDLFSFKPTTIPTFPLKGKESLKAVPSPSGGGLAWGWGWVVLASALCSIATAAERPATYPTRPIRLIVSFAPGGSVDVVARVVSQKLSEALGQQVVIDNRPGAGGNLSAELAARAAPDGYTLYMSSASLVVNPSLYRKVGYDPVTDFAPITLLAAVQNVLVANPSVPAKSVQELVALARKTPGRLNYASTGSGSSGHLAMELFRSMTAIDLVHVPYKSAGQAQVDLLAGHVALWFPTIPGALPFIRAGKIHALAVSATTRSPALPDLATVAEAGVKGFDASTWYPVLAPTGVAPEIVTRLNRELVATVRAPQVKEQLVQAGVEPIGSSPDELARHITSELQKWAQVIQRSRIRVE
jgi:tripartite-type tricarboxylate transporter receptor subunit TctC